MSESAPRRRWFRFGLGAIVWLVTLVAFAVMTISSGRQQVRLENEIKELRAALREVHEKQASESGGAKRDKIRGIPGPDSQAAIVMACRFSARCQVTGSVRSAKGRSTGALMVGPTAGLWGFNELYDAATV